MSSEIAIKVENLSKCYQIYDQPRDRLKQFILPRLQGIARQPSKQYFREFWALKDASFEIKKGETVGIVGRNGCGKSTLLQLICRTLNATFGEIKTQGRIAALLELGSGFNPEFTGRENVYLNGLILGLTTSEVKSRMDEIEAFAGIGGFIDQPAKTYSSGMLVRLAFAVQVSLQPDIIIIDEALAVGDAGFQLKCMLRIQDLQSKGTTILLVSHDAGSVMRLCSRAILIDNGNIKADSQDVLSVLKQYDVITRNSHHQGSQLRIDANNKIYPEELGGISETRIGTREAEYLKVEFIDTSGVAKSVFNSGEEINIRALIKSYSDFSKVVSGFTLKNISGVDVWGDNTIYGGVNLSLSKGFYYINYQFQLFLPAGEYFLYIGLADLTNERVELDQRWPVRKLTVASRRQCLGYVYSPAKITFGLESSSAAQL
jgi:lipopolysaccharide transport system ATP-binding protein